MKKLDKNSKSDNRAKQPRRQRKDKLRILVKGSATCVTEPDTPDDVTTTTLSPITQEYVAKITRSWAKAAASWIECGKYLLDAKEGPNRVPYGEFGKMFRTAEHRGPDRLPFSQRMGDYMIAIASHPVLSDSKYLANLPPSLTTLYDIATTTFPPGALEQLLDSGVINNETSRKGFQDLGYQLIEEWTRGVSTLVKYMEKWQAATLARTITQYAYIFYTMNDKDEINAVQALIPWLTEFHAECVKIWDEKGAAAEREAMARPAIEGCEADDVLDESESASAL